MGVLAEDDVLLALFLGVPGAGFVDVIPTANPGAKLQGVVALVDPVPDGLGVQAGLVVVLVALLAGQPFVPLLGCFGEGEDVLKKGVARAGIEHPLALAGEALGGEDGPVGLADPGRGLDQQHVVRLRLGQVVGQRGVDDAAGLGERRRRHGQVWGGHRDERALEGGAGKLGRFFGRRGGQHRRAGVKLGGDKGVKCIHGRLTVCPGLGRPGQLRP